MVKKLFHALCCRIRLLNYEIGFIQATLSNFAERRLSTFVFANAFKSLWDKKVQARYKNKATNEMKKQGLYQFFLQKIENHKMLLGKWNRDWMAESDRNISQKYALDFSESVGRGLIISEQQNLMDLLEDTCGRDSLSHESMFALSYDRVLSELAKESETEFTDTDNFVVQFICNRNEVLQDLFQEKWEKVQAILYESISEKMEKGFKQKLAFLNDFLSKLLQDLKSQCNTKSMEFNSDKYFQFLEHRHSQYIKTKEIPFKAMNRYLQKYLDPEVTIEEFEIFLDGFEVDGIKVKVCKDYGLPLKSQTIFLEMVIFRRLVNTEMFNSTELIFNIYEYVEQFKTVLEGCKFVFALDEFEKMSLNLKTELEKNIIGCPSQCPCCGKFCERKIHPNEGKCQIQTGHQISSMGGSVWGENKENTAVLFICDDYKDYTQINLPCGVMEWGEFKNKCCSEWDWNIPTEEKYRSKQQSNPKLMKDIWNKFGRGILNYHKQIQKTQISFVPYTTYEEINEPLLPISYFICFVIDGTGSMNLDISRVIMSVRQLIDSFITKGNSAQFRVVIYRDHCDERVIESFPECNVFTPEQNEVENFLTKVEATGGGDFPEAVLDGLATAATQSDWKRTPGVRNKIIHIFDAPPHGNFPNYESHSSYSDKNNCCCCNQGTLCNFNWDRDVWSFLKKFKIEYHGINTTPSQFKFSSYNNFRKSFKKMAMECFHRIDIDSVYSKYGSKMREELGHLCGNFQVVGKEAVNDAILKIFVDFKQ